MAVISADEINAIPEKFRQYIHDLETRWDKSLDVQTISQRSKRMTGAAGIATMSATEIAVADSGVVTNGNIAAVVADDAFIIMDTAVGGKPFRSRLIDQCRKVVVPAGLSLNGFCGPDQPPDGDCNDQQQEKSDE